MVKYPIEPPHYCRLCFHCVKEWGWICWNKEGKFFSQDREPKDLGCKCWINRVGGSK